MDWALKYVFSWLNGLPWLLLLYDIMCQYGVNVRRRFSESPSLKWPSTLKHFHGGIGQFHIHGHRPACFPRFSVNFIKGAGYQDGEILETLWSKTNKTADSVRGMTASHRREVIDDHMNDSNWGKLTRIGMSKLRSVKVPAIEVDLQLFCSRKSGYEFVRSLSQQD